MIRKLFFNKNFKVGSIYLIANIINKAIAFLTIPIFTRLLTTNEYGIVSTYSSYVLVLQFFMGLSSEYTIRNAYIDFENEIDDYVFSMYSLAFFVSFIISVIIYVLNETTLHITTNMICACCLLQSFMTYINNAMSDKLMMEKDYIKRSMLISMPNILSVILGVIFVLAMKENRSLGRILGYVIAISMFGIYNILRIYKLSKKNIRLEYYIYILKISPPMIFHGLSIVLLSQLDRIMITSLRNSSETGVYSLIYSMSLIAYAISNAINGVWTPWFTEKYKNKMYKEINRRAFQFLYILSMLTVIIMFVSPEIIKFIAPKEYWNGIPMIPPLTLASFITYVYTYYVGLELYEKRTKTISILTTIAAIVNAWTNYIFIPRYGALAAAYTTLFSYIVLFLLHAIVSTQLNNNLFGLKIVLLPIMIATLATVLFYMTSNNCIFRWSIAFITIIALVYKLLKYNPK